MTGSALSPDDALHRRGNHEAPPVLLILRDAAARLFRMRSDRNRGQSVACPPFTMTLRRELVGTLRFAHPTLYLIRDPQAQAAVKRIADRLRTCSAVEEEIGD